MKAAGVALNPEDVEPELPPAAKWIVDLFLELNSGRGSNGFGPNPISFTEIANYCGLMKRDLWPWVIKAVKKIDSAYLNASSQAAAEKKPQA
jgi:hypothetical protein